MLQRGHSGDGCVLASTLCKYDLRKGDLFVLSWARVRRVRRGSISSELLVCGGGVRSILLLPLVARCLETIDVCIWRMLRIVTQERLRDHDSMSRALIGLHWLPVDKRIEYKLLLYTYKALHDLAPGYLCELVVPYVPRRVLSAELNLLTVPPGKPGKYGSRSFARASANLWNSLRGERAAWLKNSPTLESFKRNLKTFLFWERFPS